MSMRERNLQRLHQMGLISDAKYVERTGRPVPGMHENAAEPRPSFDDLKADLAALDRQQQTPDQRREAAIAKAKADRDKGLEIIRYEEATALAGCPDETTRAELRKQYDERRGQIHRTFDQQKHRADRLLELAHRSRSVANEHLLQQLVDRELARGVSHHAATERAARRLAELQQRSHREDGRSDIPGMADRRTVLAAQIAALEAKQNTGRRG